MRGTSQCLKVIYVSVFYLYVFVPILFLTLVVILMQINDSFIGVKEGGCVGEDEGQEKKGRGLQSKYQFVWFAYPC